jgi:glycosyltransferase involved in cell wall biosynthesis
MSEIPLLVRPYPGSNSLRTIMELSRDISVVIPVYNSEQTLPCLVERLEPVLATLGAAYEVILVNDGSRDASWQVISTLAAEHPWVRGINLMRNYGQHNAILCGVRSANHAVVITMDDDLQHPPEEIPKLLVELAEGYDVVYGAPEKQQHGPLRDLASLITKMVLRTGMGAQTAQKVSAFRAFHAHLRDAFARYRNPYVSLDVLLTWGTSRFTSVTVRHEPRRVGTSNYSVRMLVLHAVNMMTGFSTLPLQIASFVGFAFTLFGVVILGYVLARYVVQGAVVPGFAFLASIITIFSGAQLFALGIIGEYLARMHSSAMERPTYTIRSATDREL